MSLRRKEEGGGEFSNRDVVRIVGDNISPSFVNYVASRGLIEATRVAKGRRSVYSFPESAINQIRGLWAQNQQGINPAAAVRIQREQGEISGFYIGFDGDSSPAYIGRRLAEDPQVSSASFLYGRSPSLLVATIHPTVVEAESWRRDMRAFGLMPNNEIDLLEVGSGTVVGSSQGESAHSFHGHVLMKIEPGYQEYVSHELRALQVDGQQGISSLATQTLRGRWNLMVNMVAASLGEFDLASRVGHIQDTAALLSSSRHPDLGASMGVAPSLVLLATSPGFDDSYVRDHLEYLQGLKSGLKTVTPLVNGEWNFALEVAPSSPEEQGLVLARVDGWNFTRDTRVHHIVSSTGAGDFFGSDARRAYFFVKASRPQQISRLIADIEQSGDRSVKAYRALGGIGTDIVAAVSLDPQDQDRVYRIHDQIRMRPFVETVDTLF